MTNIAENIVPNKDKDRIKELEEAVFVLGMALSRFGRNADRTLYGKNPEGVHRGFKFADDIWTQYESLIREIKDKAR